MAHIFREVPDAIERTWTIAERCNVKIEQISNPFPEFQGCRQVNRPTLTLKRLSREGFAERVPYLETLGRAGQLRKTIAEYETRLSDEIRMIQRMKFSGYFLVVWDFIRYARSQGIPGWPGPRFGGRQPGQLRAAHHGCGPAAIRFIVRALSESRARFES